MSLLWPPDTDEGEAHRHQEGQGSIGQPAYRKATLRMLRATYFIETQNAECLYRSITPELETIAIAGTRSSVSVHKTSDQVIIDIKASDAASCRSATNSWLRLALIAAEMDKIVADAEKNR